MVIQKSEETRTLTGFHGGLRRGTAAAALGAVLVLSAGVPAASAASLVPAPDTTDGVDATAAASLQTDVPLLEAWASVVLGHKPEPSGPPASGSNRPAPPGHRDRPTPSPSPSTEPAWTTPSPDPTSPADSPSTPPSQGTVSPSAPPAPSPGGGAAAPSTGPAQAPGAQAPGAPATGPAPAGAPAAPPSVLPGTAVPVAPGTGAAAPVPGTGTPASGNNARVPSTGSRTAGPAMAAPASAWKTTNVYGPANMAILTSAGVLPLSGPGYGVSSAPVMRSAVSVSPMGEVSPQVWWGGGLIALACAAGVAYVRMRRI